MAEREEDAERERIRDDAEEFVDAPEDPLRAAMQGFDPEDPENVRNTLTAVVQQLREARTAANDARREADQANADLAARGDRGASKDSDKIVLKPLPVDFADYETWRTKAIAVIAAASGNPTLIRGFINESDVGLTDEQLATRRDPRMVPLDMKIFNAVLDLVSGPSEEQRHLWSKIKRECSGDSEHCGRRAFRILDKVFELSSARRTKATITKLLRLKLDDKDLPKFLRRWTDLLEDLSGSTDKPTDLTLGSLLEDKVVDGGIESDTAVSAALTT